MNSPSRTLPSAQQRAPLCAIEELRGDLTAEDIIKRNTVDRNARYLISPDPGRRVSEEILEDIKSLIDDYETAEAWDKKADGSGVTLLKRLTEAVEELEKEDQGNHADQLADDFESGVTGMRPRGGLDPNG